MVAAPPVLQCFAALNYRMPSSISPGGMIGQEKEWGKSRLSERLMDSNMTWGAWRRLLEIGKL